MRSPSRILAIPKSRTLSCSLPGGRPSTSIRLEGLRSRWTIFRSCASWRTSQSCSRIRAVQSSGIGTPGVRIRLRLWPLTYSISMKAASLADPRVMDGDGVGVREPGHDPRLALEPRPRLGVEGDPRDDQLQGPRGVELEVPDEPDGPHPPLAELPLDQVAAEEDMAGLGLTALADRVDLHGCLIQGRTARPRGRREHRLVRRDRIGARRGRQFGTHLVRRPAPRQGAEGSLRLVPGSVIGLARSLRHCMRRFGGLSIDEAPPGCVRRGDSRPGPPGPSPSR